MVIAKNYLDSIEKLDEASLNEFLDYISIKINFISKRAYNALFLIVINIYVIIF